MVVKVSLSPYERLHPENRGLPMNTTMTIKLTIYSDYV